MSTATTTTTHPSPHPQIRDSQQLPRETLLRPLRALLQALTNHSPLPTLLSTFTSTHPPPIIHEHGLPGVFAPFIGRTFTGRDGVLEYFTLLAQTLQIEEMWFEEEEKWVVDVVGMTVCVRGWGRFSWIGPSNDDDYDDGGGGDDRNRDRSYGGEGKRSTSSSFCHEQGQRQGGKTWEEGFVYRIGIAEEKSDTTITTSTTAHDGNDDREGEGGKGEFKVSEYLVWGDTGAAYLAKRGQLHGS